MTITFRPKVGVKQIVVEQLDQENWLACCWCSVTGKNVEVPLTSAQAEEICSGKSERSINQILPDTPAPLRKIFLTGLTPAEFAQMADEEFAEGGVEVP